MRLLPRLLAARQFHKAKAVFTIRAEKFHLRADPSSLNSMVTCFPEPWGLAQAKTLADPTIKIGSLPFLDTRSMFFRELCLKSMLSDAIEVFFAMLGAGVLPHPRHFRLLIHLLCRYGRLDEARFLFDLMAKRASDADPVCNAMEAYGLHLDRKLCATMILGYCRERRMDVSCSLLEEMKGSAQCDPDEYAYHAVINGFLKLGYVESCWKFVDEMAERGLRPNVVSCNLMIRLCCMENRLDCGLEILDAMGKYSLAPNMRCYTVVVSSLCKENRSVDAGKLIDRMLDGGMVPDQKIFVSLSKCLPKMAYNLAITLKMVSGAGFSKLLDQLSNCNDESPQDVELLLDNFLTSGGVHCREILDFLLYILWSRGRLLAVGVLMDKMTARGYDPAVFTYFLITCLCIEGHMGAVDSLISYMHARGVVLNTAMFRAVINAHCKLGNIDMAFEMLGMMTSQGLNPCVAVYDSIIGALCREGRLLEAKDTFELMRDSGTQPDKILCTTLFIGYSKCGCIIDACDLFDEMLADGFEPSAHAYGALINGLLQCYMTRKACQYLNRMLVAGVLPDRFMYTMMISQFFRMGAVGFALCLFDLMKRNHIEWDLITYGAVINGIARNISRQQIHPSLPVKLKEAMPMLSLLSQGTVDRLKLSKMVQYNTNEEKISFALALFHDLRDSGSIPDIYIYNGIINALCQAKRVGEIDGILQKMKEDKLSPNQVTYAILIDTYFISGEPNHAVRLFNEMNEAGLRADNAIYNILTIGLAFSGRIIEALSVIYTMQKIGFVPRKSSYERLLTCLYHNYYDGLALRLFEEMVSHGYEPRFDTDRR